MVGLTSEKGKELLETGHYSDFMIKCKDKEWKVHKSIVCAESTYFATVEKGNFDEGATDRCELKEEDPEVIQLVLDFLYTDQYEVPAEKQSTKGEGDADDAVAAGDGDEALHNNTDWTDDVGIPHTQHCDGGCWDPCWACSKEDWSLQKKQAVLRTHLDVYLTADRLGIVHVREQAGWKFRNLSQACIRESFFPTMLQEICENTLGTDELRMMVLEQCACQYWKITSNGWEASEHKTLFKVLQEHEPIVWLLAAKWKRSEQDLKERLNVVESLKMEEERKNEILSNRLSVLEVSAVNAAATSKKYKNMLNGLMTFAKDGDFKCKSCGMNLLITDHGFDIQEMSADPDKANLSVPRVYIECQNCDYRKFVDKETQPQGDEAYGSVWEVQPNAPRIG